MKNILKYRRKASLSLLKVTWIYFVIHFFPHFPPMRRLKPLRVPHFPFHNSNFFHQPEVFFVANQNPRVPKLHPSPSPLFIPSSLFVRIVSCLSGPSLQTPHGIFFSFCFSNQTKGSEKSENATFSISLCLLTRKKGNPGKKKKKNPKKHTTT